MPPTLYPIRDSPLSLYSANLEAICLLWWYLEVPDFRTAAREGALYELGSSPHDNSCVNGQRWKK